MRNARDIRLQSDYDHVRDLAVHSGGTLVVEKTLGEPPDRYTVVYKCRTIERLERGKPIFRTTSRVEIVLPAKYPAPFAAPKVRMLTPVWHPHVYKNLVVCMGDWTTSEYLDAFVLRLGALLQFEKEFFDIRDPANEEAIDWARRNLLLFPTDTCTFRNDPSPRIDTPSGFTPIMPLNQIDTPEHNESSADDHRTAAPEGPDTILWQDLV